MGTIVMGHWGASSKRMRRSERKLPQNLELSEILPIFAASEQQFWLSGQNPEGAGHSLTPPQEQDITITTPL